MKKITVGELGKVVTGNTPPRNQPSLYGNHTIFIKPTDISETSKYTYTPEECYSEKGANKYKNSLIPKGATCVVTIGSIGKKITMAHTDCYINQAMNAIIPNENYDEEYVYYLIKNNLSKLKSIDSGTSSGRENVSKSSFSNMGLYVVDNKDSQIQIGKILSAYDDLIENNQNQIKLLEEAAMRLYKEWFVNLRFPRYETARIVDRLPEGWNKSTVGEVTSMLRRGISPKYNKKGKSIVINQKCIRQFMVSLEESRYQDKPFLEDMRLVDGDVVICSTGTGTLGRVGQIFGDLYECTFDTHVTLVRANNNIGKNYLGQALCFLQPYLKNMGKGSTNQTELSRASISLIPIVVPSERVLNDFERIVQSIREKMLCCANIVERLKLSRDKMLPKLISGEIEV